MLIIDLLLPVLIGLALGLVCRRSPRSLARLQPSHVWLLWLAGAIQLAEYAVPPLRRLALSDGRGGFTAAIFACVAACLWLNANRFRGPTRAAWVAIGVGAVLNAVPLALNGVMPFDRSAAVAIGMSPTTIDATLVKNGVADAGTHLPWLGDIIPVAPLHLIISIGDIAICVGVALLVFSGMAGAPGAPTVPRPAPGVGFATPRREES